MGRALDENTLTMLITVEAAEKGVLRWWSHYTIFFPLVYIFETFHNRR